MTLYAQVAYTGDGSETDFSLPFEYILKSHVFVTVDDEDLTYGEDYTIAGAVLSFTEAPADESAIVITRSSSPADRLVDWSDGSGVSEKSLDKDGNQAQYLIQEALDGIEGLRAVLASNGSGLYEAGTGIEFTLNTETGVTAIGLFSALVAALSGGSVSEVGSSVASVDLTWSYNKAITAQELAGTGTSSPLLAARTQTATGPYTTDTTFTVTGHTATESDDATTSVTFLRKRHWGVSASTSLNTAAILGLAGAEFSTAKAQSRTLTPSSQYLYFAWPQTFGGDENADFTVNGLLVTGWVKTVVSHTNASGSTTNYNVFRSPNPLSGSFNVGVA